MPVPGTPAFSALPAPLLSAGGRARAARARPRPHRAAGPPAPPAAVLDHGSRTRPARVEGREGAGAAEGKDERLGGVVRSGSPPGPVPLPVIGNALDIVATGLAELMLSYARRYGPFVRFQILSDVMYLTSSPEAIAWVNAGNSRNYLDRWTPPGFETLLYDGRLRGLVFSQGRYWMQHRQIVGSAFRSAAFLDGFVRAVRDKAAYLMDRRWEAAGRVGGVVNVHQEMRLFTLDVIGDAAFGAEFGAMVAGGHEIEDCLARVLNGVMGIIKAPLPLWQIIKTPGRQGIERDMRRLHAIEMGLVETRRARARAEEDGTAVPVDGKGKADLLGMLLKARDGEENRAFNFTDDDLMWDVHDIIFAGHETTASALGAALFQIAGSERVEAEIVAELDRVLPGGRELQFDDIAKLEYIEMVVNETLRLVPPTALIGRIAKEADVLDGYPVPAGANVLMSPYVMGRLARLWDEPEEFRPERFAKDAVAARHPMVHTPFGAGPRVCLGARMATMEAKAALAVVLQKYTFERTRDELVCDYNSTVSFKSGMEMVLRRREPAR
jgi:enediyne biosynthesis protein E7